MNGVPDATISMRLSYEALRALVPLSRCAKRMEVDADGVDVHVTLYGADELRVRLALRGVEVEPDEGDVSYFAKDRPSYHAWICPICGRQYRGPGGHHVSGDDCASSCFHAHIGEHGVSQPGLVRIDVVPAHRLPLQPIPRDQPPRAEEPEAVEGVA